MPGSAISRSCEMLQFSASLKSSVFIYKMDTITLALTSSIVDEIKWDDPNISGKLKEKKKENLKSNSPNLITQVLQNTLPSNEECFYICKYR